MATSINSYANFNVRGCDYPEASVDHVSNTGQIQANPPVASERPYTGKPNRKDGNHNRD